MSEGMFLNLTDVIVREHQDSIFDEIAQERSRQQEKWGVQTHSISEWLMILGEEFGEACKSGNETYFRDNPLGNLRKELVQTIAVATAIIEGIDEKVKGDSDIGGRR
jgi:hypothetical protein